MTYEVQELPLEKCPRTHTQIMMNLANPLVEQGIDPISLNPDSVLKTLLKIASAEESKL
ncbi:hypothetical protein IQ259_20165 [Fortiea sp. LEGE XX443]|uniref:hypothetical protein n=1 Tax=Fortiea sp. LEGE XX443 TaxID=1828611 RepID=UPI00187E0654|nr:hypothetical protein [Fortiea sp. LEGE XX443]MBE9007319.1 hypothetical protein [Fortiea sp. LEGE XX443]